MKRGEVVLMIGLLGVMAWASPQPPFETDRDVYERMGREWIIPNCNDYHCFRPMVSWVLGRVPGPPIVIWKAYAVLGEAAAGVAMAWWVMRWNISAHTARIIGWLTAFGSGACYTLFDPHSSDPFMHLLGPAVMLAIDRKRIGAATVASAVGVMAKEFAALPLAISAATRGIQERWPEMWKLTAAATGVLALWIGWQLFARSVFNYSTGSTYSADLTTGSFIVFWLLTLSTTLVITLMAIVLGGLWLLWPAGLLWGPRELRQLTFASIPAMLVLNAVQQPDRALWNFAFLIMPAAAIVLDRVPASWGWALVAVQVVLNARFGAQLTMLPPARITLTLSILIAAVMVWRARAAATAMPLES